MARDDDVQLFNSNASIGFDGLGANAKVGSSLIKGGDEDANYKFFSTSAEARAGLDGCRFKAGVNLAESEIKGIKSSIGVNVDTGGSISRDGVEAKVAGLGFKIGKETGYMYSQFIVF
ncbi:hypothetical protein C1645_734453 [Glomus cerebriforme]|uniref:Uncharacterized protein n=1 Tax=Glomus cerebriforme TaxID=658196 RepID=A0A397TAK7_9GLOM|nr:hypothetical protein C1645_734453 [Glomus cerebriforme]